MERALPPLSITILPPTHDPWLLYDGSPPSTATYASMNSTLKPLKALLALIVLVIIVVTIVGNALVCLAVVLVRKLKHPANFLIVSLAIADFLVGLLVMPLASVDLLFSKWPLGRSMCKLWTTADLTLCTASIVSLCAISVDRYLIITRPLRYAAARTTTRMLFYIAVVWIIAAIVSLSSHIISNLLDSETPENQICQVIQHFAYQIYATIISFYGPTVIMLVLYVQIWRAAKRIARNDHDQTIHIHSGLDKNGNDRIKLFSGSEKSSQIVKNEQRRYLHRPSAFFHAVKVPLVRF